MIRNQLIQWIINFLESIKKPENKEGIEEVKKSSKAGKANKKPYMMNRELSWLKFNERVLNEAGNPRVPLAERLTFFCVCNSELPSWKES